MRNRNTVLRRQPDRVAEDRLDLKFAPGLVILQHAGFIRREVPGIFDLRFGVRLRQRHAARIRDCDDLPHQRPAEPFELVALRHLLRRRAAGQHRNRVERQIPEQLVPADETDVLAKLASDLRRLEQRGKTPRLRADSGRIVSHLQLAAAQVQHPARCRTRNTDVGDRAQQPVVGE